MPGTWPTSARSRSSRPSICPSIDPSSMPSFTSLRPLPPTRSTRSSPSSTCSPAIVSKPQPENPLSGLLTLVVTERMVGVSRQRADPQRDKGREGRRNVDDAFQGVRIERDAAGHPIGGKLQTEYDEADDNASHRCLHGMAHASLL